MNIEAILHVPDSKFCFATSDKQVVLRLRTSKKDSFSKVEVVYGCKYDFAQNQLRQQMQLAFCDGVFNYYTIKLCLDDVRFVYVFEITDGEHTKYFSEDGITNKFDFTLAYYNSFQLPYINKSDIHQTVDWMKSAVFYEIFVDRFNKGSVKKDESYINIKWGDKIYPKSFAGGDIRGIIEKLNYLVYLGINVIYLTPIFKSISNHKYDISDYYNVDQQFGTNEDFKELVDKAHAFGIRIVLDAVFNHCSDEMQQFKDVVEFGKKSKYYDWFLIDGDFPKTWEQDGLDYYGKPAKLDKSNFECFASCTYMPKLNTSNTEVQDYLIDIATHYITQYDIDGWRLDVSDEIAHSFWRHFKEKVKQAKPDAVIIGENWHDANPFLRGGEYDSIMNYAFTKACKDLFIDNVIDSKQFAERLSGLLMRNSDQVNSMMLNIIDSHDTHRFLEQCNGNKSKMLCALAVMFCFVGAPGLYYGTEIGIMGGYDPDCRRCFNWELLENIVSCGENFSGDSCELFYCLRQLINLKKTDKNLQDGSIKLLSNNGLFVIEREFDNSTTQLIVNPTNKEIEFGTQTDKVLAHNISDKWIKPNGFLIKQF